MKVIELTKGLVALVDDEDFDRLNQYKWFADLGRHTFYALRMVPAGFGKQKKVRMHQSVLEGVLKVDHKNGVGLDNRKENLRPATTSQNNMNTRKRKDNTSGFKGVAWSKIHNKWRADIRISKVRKHLGLFRDKSEAAKAYDAAAIKYFGEFARPNFPQAVA